MKTAVKVALEVSPDAEEQLMSFIHKFNPNDQALVRSTMLFGLL
jgi:hypothetical protein